MPLPNDPVLVVLDQSNAYQASLVAGMRSALEPARIPLLLIARDPFAQGLTSCLQRALDTLSPRGVITTTLDNPVAEGHLRAALALLPGLPTVHVGSHVAGCSVRADNAVGMEEVVRHLITDCGVRRPLVVRGIRHHADSVEREGVLRRVFAEHGIELDESLFVDGHFHRDNAYRLVNEVLRVRRDLDAVIAFNDRSALGAMDAVTEAGLRIPQDVVVVGFDDDESSAYSVPPLTSVSQDSEGQGALAARLLLRSIDGERLGEVRVPTRVVVRESSARVGGRVERASGRAELEPLGELVGSSSSTRGLWADLAALDITLSMTRAFMGCTTIAELVHELAAALPRLNIVRCFVVLLASHEAGALANPIGSAGAGAGTGAGSVVLAYAPGLPETPMSELFDAAQILPAHLAHHLHEGTLMMQPLSTERRELGYLLLEQRDVDRFVSDALRMDLSRSLETLARTAELAEHAHLLQALVADRTRALEAEVATRRRAQDELLVLNEELRLRLHVDGLTGICNRVGFDETLGARWIEHSRSGAPLSLLMIDTDNFKQFNDTYGHLAGDDCLRTVAGALSEATNRPQDLAARYGGDEFAVILPNTPPAGALLVAERIRALLAAAGIGHDGSPFGVVTVTIGVATMNADPGPHSAALVAAADGALYAAKAAGRNRTVVASGGALPG